MPGKPARSGMAAINDAAGSLSPVEDREGLEESVASHPSTARPQIPGLEPRDPKGSLHLFTEQGPTPGGFGTLLVECSVCHRETPVTVPTLVRGALPFSLHLPLVKRFHSYMKCPACGRRTWVRVLWEG
jgi:hypothetical protein